MSAPVPGGRPTDVERLAALRSALEAVEAVEAAAADRDDAADPDDATRTDATAAPDPAAEADRYEALHDALVDVLAAAESEARAPTDPPPAAPGVG